MASAAGFAILSRFGRGMPASIQASISWKSSSTRSRRLDLLQHAPVRVDEADVAAARDPEVGVAGLARAVHRAAHDGDLEGLRVVAEPGLDLDRQVLDADVVAAAGRAGDHHRAALAQAERLEDLPADLDLLDRVGGERDAERVADAVREQRADADGALDRARERRPRLGDAEVQRVRNLRGEHPVGPDHRGHVRGLDRDLEVAVVEALEQLHLLQRGGDERLRLVTARQIVEVARERAGVGADAHRDAGAFGRLDDLDDLVRAADVAGVDAHGRDARVDRLQRQARVEVDVGDHRERREPNDAAERLGVLRLRHGAAHQLAARGRERGNLGDRRLDVARRRQRHRLHDHRRAAADGHAADRAACPGSLAITT